MDAHSQTIQDRIKRLRTRIRELMAHHTEYTETYYGSMLAYQPVKRRFTPCEEASGTILENERPEPAYDKGVR